MPEKLTDAEEKIFLSSKCPDCGGPLLEGPSGGMSQNMLCGGLGESRFNYIGPFGVERIGVARCPQIYTLERPKRTPDEIVEELIKERNAAVIQLKNYFKKDESIKKPTLWQRYWTIGDPLAYYIAALVSGIALAIALWKC